MHSNIQMSQESVIPLSTCETGPFLLSRGRIKGVRCDVLLGRLLHLTTIHQTIQQTIQQSIQQTIQQIIQRTLQRSSNRPSNNQARYLPALATLASLATAYGAKTSSPPFLCASTNIPFQRWIFPLMSPHAWRGVGLPVWPRPRGPHEDPVQSGRTVTSVSPSPRPVLGGPYKYDAIRRVEVFWRS